MINAVFRRWGLTAIAVGLLPVSGPFAATQAAEPLSTNDTEMGFVVFQKSCTTCHGNPAIERAPTPAQLRALAPEKIYTALTSGVMKAVGDTLSDLQRRKVAVSLGGRPLELVSGAARDLPNRCTSNPRMPDAAQGPGWNGWGAGLANSRFQPAEQAGLDASTVGRLTLKWAFGLPNAGSAYAQPTVVAGRVFVGSETGDVYSLDAKTGCVYWSYRSKAGVRNAMTVGPVQGQGTARQAVYYGDLMANVYALDAQTGRLLWTRKVERNYTQRVTAAPALYQGRLYVPVSSWEEISAATASYPCCTAVGSVVALNANSGRQLWKTYVIPERPRIVGHNALGTPRWAPAGGAVWNTPTIDPKRRAVYFGTGDATTFPAAATSDSVMALNMDTGKRLWSYQVLANDSFLVGCPQAEQPNNCPPVQGPDYDIPASVILSTVNGRDALLVGTKPGDILALDPADSGKLLWQSRASLALAPSDAPGTPPGTKPKRSGVLWGGAASADVAYFGLTGGGVAAMRINDGQRLWYSRFGIPEAQTVSHGAATTAIPGVVFLGGSDGRLNAVSSTDGSLLWQFDTNIAFDAVNKVPTHGGSISSAGATVVDGQVFVGSGYSVLGGIPGNALLMFGRD